MDIKIAVLLSITVSLGAMEEQKVSLERRCTESEDTASYTELLMHQIKELVPALTSFSDQTILDVLEKQQSSVLDSLSEQLHNFSSVQIRRNQVDPRKVKELEFTTRFLSLFAEHNSIQKSILESTILHAKEALAESKKANDLAGKIQEDGKQESKMNCRRTWIMFAISTGVAMVPIIMSAIALSL